MDSSSPSSLVVRLPCPRAETLARVRRAAANTGPVHATYSSPSRRSSPLPIESTRSLADDADELHCFAARLGIHRVSYQGPPRTPVPHYDITAYERQRAIALGAIACSRDEIVAVVRRMRSRAGVPRTDAA